MQGSALARGGMIELARVAGMVSKSGENYCAECMHVVAKPQVIRISSFPRSLIRGNKSGAAVQAKWVRRTCMEQNLGPHMLQKWAVLAGSCGNVASW